MNREIDFGDLRTMTSAMKYDEQRICNSAAAAYRLWRSEKTDTSLVPFIGSLQHLLELLERDDTATWKDTFANLLAQAISLQATDYNQDDLTRIAEEIQQTRRGLCNFNGHVPAERGRAATWVDEFDRRRRQMYQRAAELFPNRD